MPLPPPPPGFQLDSGPQPVSFGAPSLRMIVPRQPKTATPQTPEQRALTQAQIQAAQLEAAKNKRDLSVPTLTPGQKASDEAFGKEYTDWKAGGGFSDVQKQLIQLRDAHSQLGSGKNLTGPILGRMPDAITAFTNPSAIAVRQEVEDSIQRSLRMVLGAQYTEKEGVRMVSRAYDPSLPESTNRVRVTRLFNQLATAAKAKESAARYFEQKGTLTGWKGKLWSINDFDPGRGVAGAKPPAKPTQSSMRLPKGWSVEVEP